jgi:hypothetical protein
MCFTDTSLDRLICKIHEAGFLTEKCDEEDRS